MATRIVTFDDTNKVLTDLPFSGFLDSVAVVSGSYDDVITSGNYSMDADLTNRPLAGVGFYLTVYSESITSLIQIAYSKTGSSSYYRTLTGVSWSAWNTVPDSVTLDEKITGPESSVDNHIFVADGITGKLAKDGGLSLLNVTDSDKRFAISTALTTTQTIADDAVYSIFPVTTSTNQIIITLPDATLVKRKLKFFKTDATTGRFCLLTKTGQTIDGVTANGTTYYPSCPSSTIGGVGAQFHGFCVESDGANWFVTETIKPTEKQYIMGETYNGIAIAVTGTPTVASLPRGVIIPYQTINGAWRAKGNAYWTVASSARTYGNIAINGILFKVGFGDQSCSGYQSAYSTIYSTAYARGNTNILQIAHASVATTFYQISFDVELDSKPTWMD